jgi:hypothetical protein
MAAAEVSIDSVKKELPYRIEKYLKDEKIANKLVSKWFNRQPDGSFDFDLVSERGIFNASFLDTKTAESSSDGVALLKTAGLELINNTFVVINRFNFYANEPVAAAIRDVAKAELAKKMASLKAFSTTSEFGNLPDSTTIVCKELLRYFTSIGCSCAKAPTFKKMRLASRKEFFMFIDLLIKGFVDLIDDSVIDFAFFCNNSRI